MLVVESPLEREFRVLTGLYRAGRFSTRKAAVQPRWLSAAGVLTTSHPSWGHRSSRTRASAGSAGCSSDRSDDPEPAGSGAGLAGGATFDALAAVGRIRDTADAAYQNRQWSTGVIDAVRGTAVNTSAAITALRDFDSLIAWAERARAELVVAVAGTEPQSLAEAREMTGRSLEDIGAAELAAALGLSTNAALGLAHQSRALCLWLPTVSTLLGAGEINKAKVRIVTDGAWTLRHYLPAGKATDEAIVEAMMRYDRMVTRNIVKQSNAALRQVVRLAIQRIAAPTIEERHKRAVDERSIEMFDAGDGMSTLQATLPTLAATRVWQVLEHHAKTQPGEGGSHQARMVDALVSIVDGTSELPPQRRHEVAQVQVVVGIGTLLGTHDDAAQLRGGEGWLTAQTVRELAEHSALRRLIVDDIDGQLLQFGRSIYRPPANLRDHITARDVKCRAPGCGRDALYCDVDHIVPWDSGGGTDVGNLASLCRRHHVLKTFGNWSYTLDQDGSTKWGLPSGVVAVDPPTPVIPVVDDLPPF